MPAYKDKAKGTWYASFYFENWTGKKEKKMKRGFKTKREALEWERTFLQQQTADLDMTFESFVALYAADMKGRIKENTWGTKEHILYKKLVPYFGKRKMSEIHSKEVMAWQSEMLNYRDKNGKSNRVIQMPAFLCEEMEDYIKSLYAVEPTDRIFAVTKSYLHREMDRGAKEAGVKRIRIHDLRHSHISLLIDMGFTALAIADRVGHESIDITYRYAHLFPTRQAEMADKLNMERKGA